MILLARRDWGARMPTRTPVTIPADTRSGVYSITYEAA